MDAKRLRIGFFDSGIGGLAVLKCALQELPNEDYIFYGDNGNVPYGEKTAEEVRRLTIGCCDTIFDMGVKAILVACNTATSAAILTMREKYKIPVVSIEPAIKPASESRKPGKIVVLATPGMISSERYDRLIEKVGCRERLVNIPCGGLADMLESGNFEDPALDEYLIDKFNLLKGVPVSGIVIGCTHYSFISEKIQHIATQILNGPCGIYDGMYGTVRHLKNILAKADMLNPGPGGNVECHSSGGEASLRVIYKILNT